MKSKFLFLFFCLFLFSCEDAAVYESYVSIGDKWEKEEEYYFTFTIPDTSIPYEVTLDIRNNNLYPYQNLWLFRQEEQPSGQIRRDTMECMLADDYGKWYGKGISLYQMSFPLHTRYFFPDTGTYTFSFRQGMRNDNLPGIQEIGLRIIPSAP